MDINELKILIKRLVDEAVIVAPSISRFDKDGNYGSVTDENFDSDSFVSWELEARTLVRRLASIYPSIFEDLHTDYNKIKEESRGWHSRSILVHRVRQLLASASVLLESPLIHADSTKEREPAKCGFEPGYAFIAMAMDPQDHSLVDVLEALKEASLRCGVRAERIDEPQSNERITDRIMESIRKAEYILVDLTNLRPNVFFEAGYAHGLGKIPIYFARHGTKLEFDLKDYPVLFFRNLKELKDVIEKRIAGLKEKRGT